ncbi:MAG: TlyA family RNA methyltransferase [Spirochaetales bacterium]|nr:TlyA family RNA methyltransferase [Spirochaetales bacterium]
MVASLGPRLLDYLVELFPDQTRESLFARILCGDVDVDGERIKDPKTRVNPGAGVALSSKKFVSRGGLKLEAALELWKPAVEGRVWLDAGASTGGFTDCLLQRGAKLVHAIDVGNNQLAWKLRSDPRVKVQEKMNIMDVKELDPQPFGATADLSFRSLRGAARKILSLTTGNLLVALVKPQFEWLDPDPKFSGIVPDQRSSKILEILFADLASEGVRVRDCILSPIRGHKGNQESLVWLERISGG